MDKRAAGFFAAGFLTAAALFKINAWLRKSQQRILTNDDDVIVVAGGSLKMSSKLGRKFNPGSNPNEAVQENDKAILTAIDIWYTTDAHSGQADIHYPDRIHPLNRPTTITIDYQKDPLDANPSLNDSVTISTNASGQGIKVSNTSNTYPIRRTTPTQILQHDADWCISKISVNGDPGDSASKINCGRTRKRCIVLTLKKS